LRARIRKERPILSSARCQVGRPCDRVPCFQARLEAVAGNRPVRRHAALCADHLGDAVQALAAWARERGLEGKVTVLAVDQPEPGQPPPGAPPGDQPGYGFVFATISLNP